MVVPRDDNSRNELREIVGNLFGAYNHSHLLSNGFGKSPLISITRVTFSLVTRVLKIAAKYSSSMCVLIYRDLSPLLAWTQRQRRAAAFDLLASQETVWGGATALTEPRRHCIKIFCVRRGPEAADSSLDSLLVRRMELFEWLMESKVVKTSGVVVE